MAALVRCTSVSGGVTVLDADPAILYLNDVIYIPFEDPRSQPGIFDHGQKLVTQSWYFRGINPLGKNAILGTTYDYRSLHSVAPDPLYIYCGWMHRHFGHFLLSTLSRFWSRVWERHPEAKILVHAHDDLDWWFSRPWFTALMRALGLTRERFQVFNTPTAIRHIIIAAPAFEEENFSHRGFARFGNEIGRVLAGDRIGEIDNRPVFLSKEKLTSGVQRLENEHEITAVLERNGVEIIYPELLSLEEQAALWYRRPFVASFANSSLHTSLLAPGRTITCISYGTNLMSNYLLLDRANNTDAIYLRPVDGGFTYTGDKDGFVTNHVAHDPVGVAEDLLRGLDFQQRTLASRTGESIVRRRGFWSYADAGPLLSDPGDCLVNLALDKTVRQSSWHPWEPFRYPNGNSGVLTGQFQFHTDLEQDPWWEVDLLQPCAIRQVRMFNRIDNSGERCSTFSIGVRTEDTESWTILHRQDEPMLFGGLDGAPFSWTAPEAVTARFVRVTLLGRAYLHLDQVEVLGNKPPAAQEPDQASAPTITPPQAARLPAWIAGRFGSRNR